MTDTYKFYNPIEVQLYFFKLVDDKVSLNTYLTTVPKSLTAADTDFVVIRVPEPVDDRGCFGEIAVWVDIYVRNDDRGLQENARMLELQTALFDVISIANQNKDAPYTIMKGMRPYLDDKILEGYSTSLNRYKIRTKK